MSTAELVPPELWGLIFRHLPLVDRQHLSLTCSIFRNIVQPAFFNHLSLSIISVTVSPRGEPPRTEIRVRRSSPERIRFYSSEWVSSIVKTCELSHTILGRYDVAKAVKDGTGVLEPGGSEVMNELFELLPNFPNLSTLSLTSLTLDLLKSRRIHQITSLRNLLLGECRILEPTTGLSPLVLDQLVVSCNQQDLSLHTTGTIQATFSHLLLTLLDFAPSTISPQEVTILSLSVLHSPPLQH
ncbi:hypothetical protein JAAARDRAFT_277112 [Jaapia argillacea MUCL 33604]|uniref:F-box domain-containing protein n=1 Tax=Jaapia argillacea MUCL 33604 TaxID=933084 RepID=A0A067PSM2_9AGAM|nr:hypothetical protein JAAARDRAFT_277112 [Jaapia argillacea MUCL 33604]